MHQKDYNTITVFKYFISFLEVWKEENYGSSAEINWQAVWSFVNTSGILDGNYELMDLLDNSPEECENKVHEWITNRIFNNEPIYLLFNMSKWLFDKLEKEHNENIELAERLRFKECKCYHCKYWKDQISIWVQQYGQLDTYHKGQGSEELWKSHPIHHLTTCNKREELRENLEPRKFMNVEFSYKKFNGNRSHHFYPQPMELKDCPYFEENNVTYDEYIREYRELA